MRVSLPPSLQSPWIVPGTSFGGSVAKRRDGVAIEARVGVTSVSLAPRKGKETALAKIFYPFQILKQKCRYKVLTLKGVPLVKCGNCTPYSDRNLLRYIPSVFFTHRRLVYF
jgi:hypothetical protein